MKILKIVRGFTTNSSGSYEWLGPVSEEGSTPSGGATPPAQPVNSNINFPPPTATNPQTVLVNQPTNQNTDINQYHFLPQTSGGIIIFFVSVISGMAALIIIIREVLKNIRNKIK